MKCEKCGKQEASFHYTSNINGNITEKNLCSECSGKLGLDRDLFIYADQLFGNMFGDFSRDRRRFFSPWSGLDGFGFAMPAMVMPVIPFLLDSESDKCMEDGSCAECKVKTEAPKADHVDTEMRRRREVNMLREQMKTAAHNEDFEKAAELRDKLRELDKDDKKRA